MGVGYNLYHKKTMNIIQPKWNKVAIHAIVWLLLISVPLLLQLENERMPFRIMVNIWLMLFDICLVFYMNYLFALEKLFYRKKMVLFVLLNIFLVFFIYFMDGVVHGVLSNNIVKPPRKVSSTIQTIFIYNKFIYTLLGVGAALAVKYYDRLVQSERAREKLETEKLSSEITLLKYQIQPHFFFNTLNNIYSLIAKSPSDAQKAVHSLSKMMRYVLYDNSSTEISLSKEIAFIENYDKLMRLRLGERVKVSVDVPEDVVDINIPPLLLIPLLENAYKHGVSATEQSFIDCFVRIEDNKLVFQVSNTMFEKDNEDRSHSGIGLSNLRKRLDILYGDKYIFVSEPDGKGVFVARLEIPLVKK